MATVSTCICRLSARLQELGEDVDASGQMSREEFEEMAKPLCGRIANPLQKARISGTASGGT